VESTSISAEVERLKFTWVRTSRCRGSMLERGKRLRLLCPLPLLLRTSYLTGYFLSHLIPRVCFYAVSIAAGLDAEDRHAQVVQWEHTMALKDCQNQRSV